jgi:hypothetical protein
MAQILLCSVLLQKITSVWQLARMLAIRKKLGNSNIFAEYSEDLQSLPYVKGEGEMIGGGAGERSLQDDLSQPVPVRTQHSGLNMENKESMEQRE